MLYSLTVHEAINMATLTILATGQNWLSGSLSWSMFGYALLAIGIVVTFFSSRRYLLGYLLGGMSYYLVVEGVQSAITATTPINGGVSYIAAFVVTLFALGGFVVYRYNKAAANKPVTPSGRFIPLLRNEKRLAAQREKYIEHTPIYKNYKPRFRN